MRWVFAFGEDLSDRRLLVTVAHTANGGILPNEHFFVGLS